MEVRVYVLKHTYKDLCLQAYTPAPKTASQHTKQFVSLADLRKFRSYKGGSVRDLLRAMRNKVKESFPHALWLPASGCCCCQPVSDPDLGTELLYKSPVGGYCVQEHQQLCLQEASERTL